MNSMPCPFCNATIAPHQLRQVGAKTLCPRCGEPFPAHLLKDPPGSEPPAPEPAAATQAAPSPSWTNRKIGLSILGVMFLMAAIGLTLALGTVKSRRQNDYRAGRHTAAPHTVQAPGELAGLGFLPADVNIAAAVQVAELFKHAAGRELLEVPRPLLLDLLLGTAQKWTKLQAKDVDHIVVGTEIKDKLPQVTMVVQTRLPYDPDLMAKALHPALPSLQRGKPLFRFGLRPGEGMLWCPQPRTIVLLLRLDALKMEDLDAIPLSPRTGTEAPPRAIESILAQRVDKQSLVWAAGRLEDHDLIKELLAMAPFPAGAGQFLAKIQEFGLSLMAQEDLVVMGHFRTTDEESTGLVQKYLEESSFKNLKSLKITAPPPGAKGPEAQWLTFQVRGDGRAIREVLDQWGSGKKR